ncbi:MAG: hypothetical protein A2854_04510 [Parcubacteria group bacterium RIFCSPHIGHO2_01_FULL_56_18]|nr:MAG: hypothetical protein A2854_04510 [Parcubacteria group bacterium RIFCSPHIGHO2_01_FULL_56_18]
MRVAVLVSGVGSTLEYFLKQPASERNFEIVLVIADRMCPALEIARKHGITCAVITSSNQDALTKEILDELKRSGIELVVMAGFMRMLGPAIFEMYTGRILGSHPSLLPLFPGKNAIEQTLSAKPLPKVSWCTIFLVNEGMDTGIILAQESVPVYPFDTVGTLRERIQAIEKPLYLHVIKTTVAWYQEQGRG